jgi:hypothetical protein
MPLRRHTTADSQAAHDFLATTNRCQIVSRARLRYFSRQTFLPSKYVVGSVLRLRGSVNQKLTTIAKLLE